MLMHSADDTACFVSNPIRNPFCSGQSGQKNNVDVRGDWIKSRKHLEFWLLPQQHLPSAETVLSIGDYAAALKLLTRLSNLFAAACYLFLDTLTFYRVAKTSAIQSRC